VNALLHMLGLDADRRTPWRNHYVTGADPGPELQQLIEQGLVERMRRPGFLPEDDRVFRATDAGIAAALAENARRHPPLTRSQARAKARYRAWLDADLDMSFGDWLKAGGYRWREPDSWGSRWQEYRS
jgi:hypothetical protein